MLTDAHCHPYYLTRVFPEAEEELKRLHVLCAASSTGLEEFAYNEDLSRRAAGILPCFAIHPQLPASKKHVTEGELERGLEAMESLAAQGRLAAVGETGFDLYNAAFKETEAVQDRLFATHLETALQHDLPVIIHARRAMHKVFALTKTLTKCRAVIFHSWSGTLEEGYALLRRGVNAYFSFGAVIMLNHKQAMRCAALFPQDRLLAETDAPYQPPRAQEFSHWTDLSRIIETMAALRREDAEGKHAASPCSDTGELEEQIEENFRAAFRLRP